MVARHGPMLLRVANQFSLCHDDALDAYQRALEIYLRRAGHGRARDRGRVAARRRQARGDGDPQRARRLGRAPTTSTSTQRARPALREVDDAVAGGERVERSVEALKCAQAGRGAGAAAEGRGPLLPGDRQHFGWTYTKVNRSITEGRARFLKVFTRIEAGEVCETLRGRCSPRSRAGRPRARRSSRSARTCATARPCRATVRDDALLAHAAARAAAAVRRGSRGCRRARTSRSVRVRAAAGASGRPRRCSGCA